MKLTTLMAMSTPKMTLKSVRVLTPSPNANIRPATTIETSASPRRNRGYEGGLEIGGIFPGQTAARLRIYRCDGEGQNGGKQKNALRLSGA